MNDDLLYDDFIMEQMKAIEWRRLCEAFIARANWFNGDHPEQWQKDLAHKYWELIRKYDKAWYDKYHPMP